MASETVVYIISQDKNTSENKKVLELAKLFGDIFLKVNIVEIEVPIDIKYPKSLTYEEMKEIYCFTWCLNDSVRDYPDNEILIVKSNSVVQTTKENLTKLVDTLLSSPHDIIYLSSWNEDCERLDHNTKISSGDNLIFHSISPHGTQALMISPDCRDRLLGIVETEKKQKINDFNDDLSSFLNEAIRDRKISALAVMPSVITIDINTLDNKNISRYNQCATTSESAHTFLNGTIFMVGIGVVLLLIILLFLTQRKK